MASATKTYIGNLGVDNFIATVALRWNITTVDLSETVTAIHQKCVPEPLKLKYANSKFLKYFHWRTGGALCMKNIQLCRTLRFMYFPNRDVSKILPSSADLEYPKHADQ